MASCSLNGHQLVVAGHSLGSSKVKRGDSWVACTSCSLRCRRIVGATITARHYLRGGSLKIKVVVHEAEEGGYWAEVPAIPGCATQGETMEELLANVHEAIDACLSVDLDQPESTGKDKVLEIAV